MYILFSRIGETKIEFSWCDMWENRICRAAGLCKYLHVASQYGKKRRRKNKILQILLAQEYTVNTIINKDYSVIC